jgi:hypothetical protein
VDGVDEVDEVDRVDELESFSSFPAGTIMNLYDSFNEVVYLPLNCPNGAKCESPG